MIEMRIMSLARGQGEAAALEPPANGIEHHESLIAAGGRELRASGRAAALAESQQAAHVLAVAQNGVAARDVGRFCR